MTVLAVMAAGAGIGLGVFLGVRALHPRPAPLARALADLERPRSSIEKIDTVTAADGDAADRLGKAAIRFFEATGLVDLGGLRHRLRAVGKPIERHAYEKLAGGITGLTLPVIFSLALAEAGVTVPPGLTVLPRKVKL